jgi:hypothetical protein
MPRPPREATDGGAEDVLVNVNVNVTGSGARFTVRLPVA